MLLDDYVQRSCNITQKQMNLLTLYFPRFLKKTHKGIMTTPGVPNYLAFYIQNILGTFL